jgi:hypothetical protein
MGNTHPKKVSTTITQNENTTNDIWPMGHFTFDTPMRILCSIKKSNSTLELTHGMSSKDHVTTAIQCIHVVACQSWFLKKCGLCCLSSLQGSYSQEWFKACCSSVHANIEKNHHFGLTKPVTSIRADRPLRGWTTPTQAPALHFLCVYVCMFGLTISGTPHF